MLLPRTIQTDSMLPLLLVIAMTIAMAGSTKGVSAQARPPKEPNRQLETPNYDDEPAESFERFDAGEQRTRENIKQLLTRQLSSAVQEQEQEQQAGFLAARQPAIFSPPVGGPTAQTMRFDSTSDDSSEEQQQEQEPEQEQESEPEQEEDTSEEDEPPQQQPQQPAQPEDNSDELAEPQPEEQEQESYDPYRDNFYDRHADGTYIYGYSLPSGVRRFERSYYTDDMPHVLSVEGFYAQPRHLSDELVYELRCYRSDSHGYQPLRVEYLKRPPRVRRGERPNVDCFKYH